MTKERIINRRYKYKLYQRVSVFVFDLKVKKFEVDEDTFYFYHSLCQQVEKIFDK